MALVSRLDASTHATPVGRIACWVVPGLLAMPTAAIGWSVDGALRLEVGVATIACVLIGWRGWASAMIGATITDIALASEPAQAIIVTCATTLAAAVSGGALRRAFTGVEHVDTADPAAPLLSTGIGALIGAVALFAYGASLFDALKLLGSLWAGALL